MDDKTIDDLIAEILGEDAVSSKSNDNEQPKPNRLWLWVLLALIVIGGGIFGVVKLTNDRNYSDYDDYADEVVEEVVEEFEEEVVMPYDYDMTTPDLTFFELHGPVKSFWEDIDGHTHKYEFNYDGELVKIDGYNPYNIDVYAEGNDNKSKYVKSHGYITQIEFYEGYEHYYWHNNRLEKQEWQSESWGGVITYTYNDSGFVAYEDSREYEATGTFSTIYTHQKLDDYGNWTKKVDNYDKCYTRVIEYY